MSLVREVECDDEASSLAMNIASWAVPSFVLKAMIELDVFEIIKRAGPGAQLSSAEIAAQLPTANPDAAVVLDRMLRLLASFSILTFSLRAQLDGDSERVYGLSLAVCKFLTKNVDGVSFAPLSLLVHDIILTQVWNNLKEAVLDGEVVFTKTHGMQSFKYLGTDARFLETFYNGMNNHSTIVMKKILDTYQGFEGISSLVDVSGAAGDTLKMILSKYPNIRGINFDLPHVVQNAPSIPGVEHVGGNMYVSVPQADAIFMKWILHNGSEEQCVRVLKNCYEALPKQGKVIVCEHLVPEVPETSQSANIAFILDVIMLAVPGGKERTKKEYEALGKQAGFQGFQLVCNACDTWVMEFLKYN